MHKNDLDHTVKFTNNYLTVKILLSDSASTRTILSGICIVSHAKKFSYFLNNSGYIFSWDITVSLASHF